MTSQSAAVAQAGLCKRTISSDEEPCPVDVVLKRQKEDSASPFDFVPNEVLLDILTNLDGFSVKRMSRVCRRFRNVVNEFDEKLAKFVLREVKVKYEVIDNMGFFIITLCLAGDAHRFPPFVVRRSIDPIGLIDLVRMDEWRYSFSSEYISKHSDLIYQLGTSNPLKGLAKFLGMLLKDAEVKRLTFDKFVFTKEFCQAMEKRLQLNNCSIDWLIIYDSDLSHISSDHFGRFIALFDSPNIQLTNLTYRMVNRDATAGKIFLQEAFQINPQLTGIAIDMRRPERYARLPGFYRRIPADPPILSGTFEYDEIFSTHIFQRVTSSLHDIVVAIRDWGDGLREIVKIDTHLDHPVSLAMFFELTESEFLGHNFDRAAKIVNTDGKYLFVQIDRTHTHLRVYSVV